MTAPAAEQDRLFASWQHWIERISDELVHAFFHQKIWTDVRDAVQARHPEADASFLVSYSRVYAESQMLAIRRVTDRDAQTASLGRLLDAMQRNPFVLSRTRYVVMRVQGGAAEHEASSHWDMRYAATPGDETVNPDILDRDLRDLTAQVQAVVTRVNKTIAHLDSRILHDPSLLPSVTFGDIRDALEYVAEMTNRYLALLNGSMMGDWVPVITGDWQAPLRGCLFDRLRERSSFDLPTR